MDLAALAKSEPKAFTKAQKFIEELKVHPKQVQVDLKP